MKPDRKRREQLVRAADYCAERAIKHADRGEWEHGWFFLDGWIENLKAACGRLKEKRKS